MDKNEREYRILKKFYHLGYTIGETESYATFREGWLGGYRMGKEELLKQLPSVEERNEDT